MKALGYARMRIIAFWKWSILSHSMDRTWSNWERRDYYTATGNISIQLLLQFVGTRYGQHQPKLANSPIMLPHIVSGRVCISFLCSTKLFFVLKVCPQHLYFGFCIPRHRLGFSILSVNRLGSTHMAVWDISHTQCYLSMFHEMMIFGWQTLATQNVTPFHPKKEQNVIFYAVNIT